LRADENKFENIFPTPFNIYFPAPPTAVIIFSTFCVFAKSMAFYLTIFIILSAYSLLSLFATTTPATTTPTTPK
jgi:hypothetical protein